MLFLHRHRVLLFQCYFLCGDAGNLRNLLFKASHAGLMGIFLYYLGHCPLVKPELLLVKAMLLKLLWNQIVLRYLIFLLSKIAAHAYHLHAVLKGRLYGVDVIRGSYEEHIGQVIVDVKIIVMERSVLLRVQSLQKSGRRVALDVLGELVNLVKHDDRIGSARTADSVKDSSRQCSDICLPVSAYLRLVMHTSEGNPDIFASEGLCHRLAQTGLSDSRRAVQAEYR